MRFAGTGDDRVTARAEKRGDSLAVEDSRLFLELALKYYAFAEKKDKQQEVRDKARSLADRATAKGESELAAHYYAIAGD